jgi:hypothetical protein
MPSRHHPDTPASHYEQALRWLEIAESSGAEAELRDLAAQISLVLAVLTLSPRKARRVERQARHAGNGLPPHLTWGDE